ncbi:hypothetical protein [Streptomyces sp. NPDC018031]|uniref:hypothetical protein n=1 Tax=Streptomyces sp. NPDC018031 TaxID=3365033 RepID=UPI0037B217D7
MTAGDSRTTEHLLIESGGPESGPACARFLGDAVRLAEDGHRVVLLLIENGVLAALPGACPEIDRLAGLGAELWVDGFSAAQRALATGDLSPAARLVDMDRVAATLLEPAVRAVWH